MGWIRAANPFHFLPKKSNMIQSDCISLKDLSSLDVVGFSQKIARLQNGNTGYEGLLIRKIIRMPDITRILFAAKPDKLNEAKMVILAMSHDDREIYIADSFSLNIARQARSLEVKKLFRDLFARSDIRALFIPERIEDTATLSAVQAYNELSTHSTKNLDRQSLTEYLGILGEWTKTANSFDVKDYLPN